MKFKIANPFMDYGKVFQKFLVVASLSSLSIGALAAAEHFFELLPVLFGQFPGPLEALLTALTAGVVAGVLAALRNFKNHYMVTPDELEEILARAKVSQRQAIRGGLSTNEASAIVQDARLTAARLRNR
jgi:hypothetical protein